MNSSEIFESPLRDLSTASSDDELSKLHVQKFYSPLSVTGYLTPLQRKKLREKRNKCCMDLNPSSFRQVKKVRIVKGKTGTDPFLCDKSKVRIKKMKTKNNIQQIQCTVSKIVQKTTDNPIKTKKFFKGSSSDRLEKANFTMPLVLKKNDFLNIDKYVKGTLLHNKKLPQYKESSCDHTSKVFGSTEKSENNALICSNEKNLHANNMFSFSMSQNSEISRESNSFVTQHESLEQISLPEEKKSVFEFDWPSDDELLRRQEEARALLRENVLRKRHIQHEYRDVENENNKQNIEGSQLKLYPIFHSAMKKKQLKYNDEIKRSHKNVNWKMKGSCKAGEQMIIDAGQKEIGAKICSSCNMIYTVGQEEDERLHLNYHNMYLISLKFSGWKKENVIFEYHDGRVIMIRKSDESFKLKKVEDILQVANRDLGFPSSAVSTKSDFTFLLFISKDKQVAGCVVAEPISKACQVLLADNRSTSKAASQEKVWRIGNWYSSSEAVPALCGVNRIWVAHCYRRQKVASRMVDCLRRHFIYGHVIGIRELAFTDPSPDGREFAAAYTRSDNFLVYK